jgi:hypothetical protein
MTIEELYLWAKQRKIETYEIVIQDYDFDNDDWRQRFRHLDEPYYDVKSKDKEVYI